ncbi:zinc-binding protein A33-like isoform X2 [Scyliorhinus canicula]|uniref:zinc-binding protein A33-like isoform X2 n=1 Tax=Scyliorhinus canicula TaxID=7830 RepID=UPI0018F42CAC|nr:zinc-binding protein A33-like isoform X2 [Scyliorhinus canicula]
MAVSKHVLNLIEGLTCSVCQSVFVEPVRLDCEHNFCKSCIQKFWGKQRQAVSCPECRQVSPRRSFTSNKVLVNLCEEARQLKEDGSLCEEQGENLREDTEREQSLCEEHREKLILFCEEDEILICAECVDSPPHADHRFLPVRKVVQKHKDQLTLSLLLMENEKKNQSELKQQQEREISELEELTVSLEKDISAQFAKIHRYLEDKEKHLIEKLRRQKEEDLLPMEENLRKIEEELVSLEEKISNLCVDIEQQDSVTFLKKLKRCKESDLDKEEGDSEKGEDEEDCLKFLDSDEESDIQSAEEEVIFPKRRYTEFQGLFLYPVWKKMKQIIFPAPESLTLNPNTAHRDLVLSERQTVVGFAGKKSQRPFDNPERFDTTQCVLGSQGFMSGKHYWEVDVGGNLRWSVGVASETANRKGMIRLVAEDGYWGVHRSDNKYVATDSRVALTPSVNPKIIGIFLDYEGGQLIFYNTDDLSVLYSFRDTFTEKLFPFLYPVNDGFGGVELKLCHSET